MLTKKNTSGPAVRCIALVALFVSLPHVGLAAETCWTRGPTQFADAVHTCVSSRLVSGGREFGPRQLADGDPRTMWCEGVHGHGIGESIVIRIDRGPAFRRLGIDGGSGTTGKIRSLRITTDTGVDTTVELGNRKGIQFLYLPKVQPHGWVKLTILGTYSSSSGGQHTCAAKVYADFEYEEELPSSKRGQPRRPLAPADNLQNLQRF